MTDNVPAASESSGRGRGGRRRGRGGAPPSGQTDGPRNAGGAPSRGSKPRGRGGKGHGGRDASQTVDGAMDKTSQAAPASTATVGPKALPAATDDADDGEVCFICASKVEHTSVSPCNHRTCHICALRLRALYKNKGCAHCRVSSPGLSHNSFASADLWEYRPSQVLSSSPTIPSGDSKTLRRRILLGRMTTLEFCMKRMKFLKTLSCYFATTAPTRTVTWLAWGGRICIAM